MSYVTFYAIVMTSGPMVEHINNGRHYGTVVLYAGSDETAQLWL